MRSILHWLAQFVLLTVFLSSISFVISSKEIEALNIVLLSATLTAGYAAGARYVYIKNGESE